MLVYVRSYPERIRSRTIGQVPSLKENEAFISRLVENGLRAQLKSGNLLTGQLYVALDFFPKAAKARVNWAANPPQFPTAPGSMAELQASRETIGDLAKDPKLFVEAAEAFRAGDAERFQDALGRAGLLGRCHYICRWFCSKAAHKCACHGIHDVKTGLNVGFADYPCPIWRPGRRTAAAQPRWFLAADI